MARAASLLLALAMAACSSALPSVMPTATSSPAPTPTPADMPSPTATASASPAAPSLPPLTDAELDSAVAGRLQDILDQRIADNPNEPSVSAAVIVPGKGMWTGATGLADVDGHQAATPDTVYAMASVTKMFTAALTLLLVRDGTIGLDDRADQWLNTAAAAKSNGATIRQLLNHTSGIASFTEGNGPVTADHPEQLLDRIGTPHFAPGTKIEYSNSNYLLLGLIIERAGGTALEQQLRARMFEPYGLDRTFLAGPEQAPPPLAHGYSDFPEVHGDQYDGSGNLPNEAAAKGAWAAGGLMSTPTDVARWLYHLSAGEILGPELTEQVFEQPSYAQFGLVFERASFPAAVDALGHVGLIPGYVALAFYLVDDGNFVVVVTNTDVEDLYLVLFDLADIAKQA